MEKKMKTDIDKDSYMYKHYLKRYSKNDPDNIEKWEKQKSEKRKKWWKENWIPFLSLIIAILALIIAAISLNFSRLSYEATSRVNEITQSESNGK